MDNSTVNISLFMNTFLLKNLVHGTAWPACLKSAQNILHNLLGAGGAAQIGAQQLALLEVGINGGVNLGGGLWLLEELEHEGGAADGGDGVGDALAHDVRGAAVARLADGEALADVGAGHEAQRSDERGGAVGEDVAVQVGGDDDVVVLGLAEELVHHGVDNLLLDGHGREARVRERLLGHLAEEAVGLGEDVGLVCDGDDGLAVDAGDGAGVADLLPAEGNVAGHGGDAEGGALRDALDGLGDAAGLGGLARRLLLDVEVLGVLADNDHVDGLGGG